MYSEQDGSKRQLPANNGDNSDLYAAIAPRTRAAAARPVRGRLLAITSGEGVCVIGLKAGEGRIEHFPARHDDDVEAGWRFQSSEQLAGQTLRSVPHDRGAQLSRGCHAQSAPRGPVWRHEEGHETATQALAALIGPLEFRTLSDPLVPGQALRHPRTSCQRSSETVRRFLPFVRRRLSTMRPFFVDIRTRKPWVLLRRRVLG
jgi:hypothetical protein